jgi:DNA-binding response OmpR family regulator
MRYNEAMAKIAIIEDDQAIAQMYRMKFEAEGYEVETAANGKLGLELTAAIKPDIVLLDVMMPDMSGDQMLTQMRQTDWGKNIKVVILTNRSEQEVSEAVRDLGVSAVIVKANMTPRHVAELVKQQLEKS